MSNRKLRVGWGLWALIFIQVSAISASAQQTQFVARSTRATSLAPISSITTLYARDPIASSLCFADGREGGIFQEGRVFNRCSHIEFDNYKAGNLSVGIEGGELGRILDLGAAEDLQREYGYERVVHDQGFSSIIFREGKLMIMKDYRKGTFQELTEAAKLFEGSTSTASAEAKAGHIYIARITDRNKKDFQILVKLLVLAATPGQSVTFRWELL